MKLEEFKDLLSIADYNMCETKMINGPTWYPLTLDVFVEILYKVICFLYFLQSPPSMFMPVPYFVLGLFEREISAAADTVARLYRENTPEVWRSAPEIWDAITKAQDRLIKTIRSHNFEKYISVAHKDNGDDFFHEVILLSQFIHFFPRCFIHVVLLDVYFLFFLWQIDRHFSTFLVTDMTIEKLQKVATTHVDAHFKAKWLRWWNSPAEVKKHYKFPFALPLRERVLKNWHNKVFFWAQVHL
jgi:hypothetical protein